MTDLLELLNAMKSHAERERTAVRSLEPRRLFELATEGEALSRRLGQLLAKVQHVPAEVMSRAAEVRALSRANAELVRRSLAVIKAVKPRLPEGGGPSSAALRAAPDTADAPAFISRVA